MNKKITAVTGLLLSAAILLSACGTPASPSSSSSTSSTTQSSDIASDSKPAEPTDETGWFKKYDPPITLTTHTVSGADAMFHEGCDAGNNGWTKWMEENLGIKWEMAWVAPDGASNTQKLDLAFASNKLPDVISTSASQIAKYAASGKLLELDGIIEEYASPLIKWHLEDAEAATKGALWLPFLKDGKKYGIPLISDTLAFWTVNFMRDDIVKELNMELPTTLAEFEAILEAYHAKYPNGIGLALDKDLNGMITVMSAFEAYPSAWVEKDGKLVYGSVQPEVRAALEKMNDWYKKGYLDPEFVVKDGSKIVEDVSQGNVLTYYGHWASIASPFTPMWSKVPDSSVSPVPFLKGENGKSGIMKDTWFTEGRAITTTCKNPEAVAYLYNESLDSYYRNEQTLRDAVKEKYDYDFKYPITPVRQPLNEKEVLEKYPNIVTPKDLWLYDYPADQEGPGFINDYYVQPGGWYGFAGRPATIANADFASMAEAVRTGDEGVLTADGKQMYDQWNGTTPNMVKTFAKIYDYWDVISKGSDVLHPNGYAGAPTATMIEKQAYLDKLQLETYTRIIMGTQPLTAFDEYVKNWNENGGSQIEKEVNDWYAQIK